MVLRSLFEKVRGSSKHIHIVEEVPPARIIEMLRPHIKNSEDLRLLLSAIRDMYPQDFTINKLLKKYKRPAIIVHSYGEEGMPFEPDNNLSRIELILRKVNVPKNKNVKVYYAKAPTIESIVISRGSTSSKVANIDHTKLITEEFYNIASQELPHTIRKIVNNTKHDGYILMVDNVISDPLYNTLSKDKKLKVFKHPLPPHGYLYPELVENQLKFLRILNFFLHYPSL